MSEQEKIYVGAGKVKEFASGGHLLKFSFSEKDVATLQKHLDNGWVNINIAKRREPSAKGATHYATIDTWKPTRRDDPAIAQQGESHPVQHADDGALPF